MLRSSSVSSASRSPLDWNSVNLPPDSLVLDLTQCCIPLQAGGSPIDVFYESSAHILTLGQPDQLHASPMLGRLLILGLVTSTEAYFRGILSGVLSICPLAREA